MQDDNKNQNNLDDTKPQQPADEIPVVSEPEQPQEKTEQLPQPEKPEETEAPKEEKIEAVEEGQPAQETVAQAPREEPVEQTTEEKSEAEQPQETSAQEAERMTSTGSEKGKWYIVHTYSGHENKVAKSLRQRIESMGFEDRIFDIIVPTRDTVRVSQGKKENVKEKIFPGYVLVRMILDDESWLLVRTTQGVTAFIGAGNKPTPISDKEVQAIQKFIATEQPLYKTSFTVGEAVKIVDGPFSDFLGTIDNIDEAKGKLKVLVSIFGRETPVELDFLQVSKL